MKYAYVSIDDSKTHSTSFAIMTDEDYEFLKKNLEIRTRMADELDHVDNDPELFVTARMTSLTHHITENIIR